MTEKESEGTKSLKDKLIRDQKKIIDLISEDERNQLYAYAEEYKTFLDRAKTERKAVSYIIDKAERAGFRPLGSESNGRVYYTARGKIIALAVRGRKPLNEGLRIITSHIDCPRLDLKPNPLYEDVGLALLKTHYYGGIKKFHWVSRNLALCGTVVRSDGSSVDIEIGLDRNDPVFVIPDLLPHLARKQMEQKASEVISGESLNIIIGGIPFPDQDTEDRVKLAVLAYLENKYGIVEEDLITAEIQAVPTDPARDAGMDRVFISAYGQDDRICAYTSLTAVIDVEDPEFTSVVVFYDKEEIGSEGNTSAKSNFLEHFLLELMDNYKEEPNLLNFHRMLSNSKALSADVTAALDPNFQDVSDKRNNAKLGHGIGLKKYTGHGGKYMASDANAEYAGWVRNLFNKNGIIWQVAGMGKIDEGGGGTVSKYLANAGAEIIDCGPGLLGMHSPLELSSKDDVWMCHRAFKTFLLSD